MINEIVTIINEQYTGLSNNMKAYALSQSFDREMGSVKERLPGIIDEYGEIKYIGFDSDYDLIIYHKLVGSAVGVGNQGTGDNFADSRTTFTMAMIIFWSRKKINVLPDDLFLVLQARTPDSMLNIKNIKTCLISITGANMTSSAVISTEYSNSDDVKLPGNMHLMQINYTIRLDYNPRCFKQCINC